MATYLELNSLASDPDLRQKVRVAVLVGAHEELAASPGTVEGRKWATLVLANPEKSAEQALFIVLAANKGLSAAQIIGASDTALQTAVNAIRASLIAATAGA